MQLQGLRKISGLECEICTRVVGEERMGVCILCCSRDKDCMSDADLDEI